MNKLCQTDPCSELSKNYEEKVGLNIILSKFRKIEESTQRKKGKKEGEGGDKKMTRNNE